MCTSNGLGTFIPVILVLQLSFQVHEYLTCFSSLYKFALLLDIQILIPETAALDPISKLALQVPINTK